MTDLPPRATTPNKMPGTTAPSALSARLLLFGLLAVSLLPLAAMVFIAIRGDVDSWPHLIAFVLPRTMVDTVSLLILVSIGTTIIGIGTAWLTALCEFPFRRFFAWALMLPLAVPVYIAAYSMVELSDFSGPLQTTFRDVMGYSSPRDYWFPDMRSVWGAGLIFSLVLYPYVYLSGRVTFSMQGAAALDVARSLGASPLRMFREIGVPMARPAIIAGVSLVLMETLNDIGAVEYLGVKTITFAIFETWLNRDSLSSAVQLSLVALVIIALFIWLERASQGGRSYKGSARERPPARMALTGWRKWAAFAGCAAPIALGLGIPLTVLGGFAVRRFDEMLQPELLSAAGSSIIMSLLTATACTVIAFGFLLTSRITRQPQLATMGRLATLGYAVPGTVLAIGLLVPLAAFDNWFDGWMRTVLGFSSGLLLSGTLFILVYACTLRFLAIAWGTVETGFGRVSDRIDMAARGLGRTPWQLAFEVHAPILKPALTAAFLLVFVDTMKELSATILLRPFGFETLATFVYGHASQAAVEEAAWAALLIVLIGLVPVVTLGRFSPVAGSR
ncbi:ABC transporter permease [Pseudahrensia aquimaris]|uniref:ABC transporter permease n=1 Tax=Pseudahrensia aquimaris TaxID=744461 RepID=A0ABW3FCH4_9HYPH